MMVESYFRSVVRKNFAMMKAAPYSLLCGSWARWHQYLCSIVDSASDVIVEFSISWYYEPSLILI